MELYADMPFAMKRLCMFSAPGARVTPPKQPCGFILLLLLMPYTIPPTVGLKPYCTVFLWFNVPCHAPAPGKGVQGTRGVHWAAPRGGVQVGGVQLLLPGFCTPRLPGRSTWRPAEYPDNVSITGVFRSLTQPRTNKPIPKSPMSRDAQCAARNLDFDVGLCVGQTGLMGVH